MMEPGIGGRIAILAPMWWELRPLIRLLSLKRRGAEEPALLSCVLGSLEIVATTTGIGTLSALHATERVLDSVPVDHLLVVGIAGGIGTSVNIGDLIVPDRVIDLSTGAEFRPHPMADEVPRGTLATSDEVLADPTQVARLERQGVMAVDMETAAIARVCERRGCPWSVFRAISDRAGAELNDPAVSRLAGRDGQPNPLALLGFVLARPSRIVRLVRLARGMKLATEVAASAAVSSIKKKCGF